MIVVGFDPATVTGAASMDSADLRDAGVNHFEHRPRVDKGERWCAYYDSAEHFIAEADLVAIEHIPFRHSSGGAARMYWSIRTAIEMCACNYGVPVSYVTPNEWRQHVHGSTKATKEECREIIARRFNLDPSDLTLDESDALCIAWTAYCRHIEENGEQEQ